MTRYFKATFSNGVIKKRSSQSRIYTHAWLVSRAYGFSSSAPLATKAAASEYGYLVDAFREVVAVEEITGKEYRAK